MRKSDTLRIEIRKSEEKMKNGLKLAGSLVIDTLGLASYAIPVWGEFADVIFFAVEAAWIKLAYKSWKFAALGGLEEILPFTDFIPACIISHYFYVKKQKKKTLVDNKVAVNG